ncbi:MAG TPA: hypothetical protein VMC80_01070 [Patescibacteria group bacterium]|nr:hypothetical protein [Patescibacteria group bacterium]
MPIENLESREEIVVRIKEILDGRTTSEPLLTREQIMYELQGILIRVGCQGMQDYFDKVEVSL